MRGLDGSHLLGRFLRDPSCSSVAAVARSRRPPARECPHTSSDRPAGEEPYHDTKRTSLQKAGATSMLTYPFAITEPRTARGGVPGLGLLASGYVSELVPRTENGTHFR
eukprot:scaffold1954_cov268-Pinguiococcus_pyrenoidosus.AAC.11